MESTPLRFDAFPTQTRDEWEALVVRALRGKDRDRALRRAIEPGFEIEPYFLPAEVAETLATHAAAGCARPTTAAWIVRENVPEASAIAPAVEGGATGIGLPAHLRPDEVGAAILAHPGVGAWHLQSSDRAVLRAALDARTSAEVLITVDAGDADAPGGEAPTGVRDLPVDGRAFHRAGAAPSLQLGLALARAAEILDAGGDAAALRLQFLTALETDFFPALARLRALRLTYARLLEAFGLDASRLPAFVQAETTRWGLTRRDPYSNVLRATIGVVAAAAGGADVIRALPFDAVGDGPADADALRLARNTQHVLRDEAFLARVTDPGAGAYYIEHLTDGLARRAWSVMQDVEARGGFSAAREAGWIDEQLDASARRAAEDVARGRTVLVGASFYAAPANGRVLPAPEADDRGAAAFEALRDAAEGAARSADAAAARLVPVGDRATASARASWVADLLRTGGIRTEIAAHSPDASTLPERLTAAPRCVVLCGDDDAYADAVPAARAALGARAGLYVAGDPAGELDVDGRLHRKQPRLDAVRAVARALGLLS